MPKNDTITAEHIVRGLIDRLVRNEQQIAVLRQELKEHMEMIAELTPRRTSDGKLKIRAIADDVNSTEQFTVILPVPPPIG